jgi:tRNA G10  N-methylase Trm11
MQYVFFLGSNPTLSATECLGILRSLGVHLRPTHQHQRFLAIDTNQELPPNFLRRLGGTDRIGIIIGQQAEPWTAADILEKLTPLPVKFKVGISSIDCEPHIVRPLPFALKKAAREQSSRLAFIEPTGGSGQLNAAQVIFNALHKAPNMELTVIHSEEMWLLVRTIEIQDIPAYEQRDTSRPARDGVVGMLPPKLAQILINLTLPANMSASGYHVYDPFCGGGTILQEAWLMNFQATGSDNSAAMVAASEKNLQWLAQHYPVKNELRPDVFVHDITAPLPEHFAQRFDAVATEPYLGAALRAPLSPAEAAQTIQTLGTLYLKAFEHIQPALRIGSKVIFILPVFRTGRAPEDLTSFPSSFLDEVAAIGYSQRALIPEEIADFYQGTQRGTIVYSRPDALVGREITLWERTSY